MEDILVSIIIPVYNVEKYLEECMNSVLEQTYQNIEILCVYDASTDNSLAVLKKYSARDKRVHLIINEKRKGLSYARNVGFENAKGKYTYFLDSDDYIKLNAIESLCYYAEVYEAECVYFNSSLLIEESEKIGKGPKLSYDLKEINKIVLDGPSLFKILTDNKVYTNSVWRRFWRTDFLIENDLWFADELCNSEDAYFSIRAILCGKRMMIVDENYHIYRRRVDSLSTAARPMEMIYLFKSYCMLLEFWRNHKFEKETSDILSDCLKDMLIAVKRIYMRNKGKIKKEDFNAGIEKHFFEVMVEQEYEKSLDAIDANILQKIRSYKYVIVYGAHIYAGEVIEKLKRKGIKITSIAVTKMYEKTEEINGIPIQEIKNLCSMKDDAVVVLGIGKINRNDVIETLKKYGFRNYISLD